MPIRLPYLLGSFRKLPLALLVSAALGLFMCWVPIALADNLSDQLLAATRETGGTNMANTCLTIDDFSSVKNTYQPQLVQADNLGDPSTHYSALTKGAYLGDAPAGAAPPPFIQALIDAGAVTPIDLNSIQTTETAVTYYIPQLRDLMGSTALSVPAAQAMPDVKQIAGVQGQAFVVTGPDAKLFVPETETFVAPVPPELEAAAVGETPTPPSGLWRTNRICYPLKADRVLEYGDFQDNGNGTSTADAFVLFHPIYIPKWISDYRVTAVLRPEMLPNDVRMVLFRNDGDGWRVIQVGGGGLVKIYVHIVANN